MEHEIETNLNGNTIITIQGEMDAYGCSQIRPTLEKVIANSNRHDVHMDLSDVVFVDSSGIGAIVFLFKRLKSQGQTLLIHGVNGQPKELMKLLRVASAINVSFGNEHLTDDSLCNL